MDFSTYTPYYTHKEVYMRTNIVLDEQLVQEAFRYAHVSTKKELIDLALREFVENHRRKDVRDLKGKVKIDDKYDYKSLRSRK
jgi:Arc/MetJ family transcription regulator